MEDEQIKENKDQEDGASSYADQDNEEGFDKEDL